ncbi:MAG: TolC family protein, partial [Acidobacteria bacterium]|nr:TolC family protein [Acidobacteriota bacterium]
MKRFLLALLAVAGLATALFAANGPSKLTLSQCIKIAEEKHPDLAAASAVVAEAAAQLKIQHSGFLPHIEAGGSYIRQTYNYTGSGSVAEVPGFAGASGTPPRLVSLFANGQSFASAPYYYGGLTVSQTIYDAGRTRAEVDRSAAELQAARRNYVEVRNTIDLDVREAYYSVLAGEELVQVRTEAVNNQTRHLEQVQAFFEVGTRPKIDVTRQAVSLANAQVNLRQAQEDLQVARAALATSMGISIDQAPEPVNTLYQEQVQETQNQLMAEAESQRPDVQALEQQVKAAQADILIARSTLRPNLGLSTFLDYRNLQFPLIYNWSLGLLAAQSIFNGGANHARIIQARAEEQAAQANLDSVLQQVAQQVYTAYAD